MLIEINKLMPHSKALVDNEKLSNLLQKVKESLETKIVYENLWIVNKLQ